jgi:triacylglycerol lipase
METSTKVPATHRRSRISTTGVRAVAENELPAPASQEELAQVAHHWKSQPLAGPIAELSILRKSLLFAELADAAYYQEQIACPMFEQIGLHASTYFERDGAQAYIISNEHDTVVICRGTEPNEWNDIKADLSAWTALAETVGRVHRGFKQEVDDIWPLLEQALANNAKTLWFTGHSLGAAMAAICAGRCKVSSIESTPVGLYTFGSPRVGSKRYVNHCKFPEYFRWVNNNDIVTRVPAIWMGYCHAGRMMYLDNKGRYRRLGPLGRARDRWRGFWRGILKGRLDPFTDHLSGNYIEYLATAVAEEAAGVDVMGRADRLWKRLARRIKKRIGT